MTDKPIDADNHYYESLDAFTRHLDKKFRDTRRAKSCSPASASSSSWAGR